MQRRLLLALPALSALGLAGCGFQLRQAPHYAFTSIYVRVGDASSLGIELKRNIRASGQVELITDATKVATAQVVLEILVDQREKTIASLTSSGQVREFLLRVRTKFRLRTPDGKELIPDAEIVQQRDISYSESTALSKEAEELLLYRSMQTDVVQQIMRRLASVKEI